MPLHLSQHKSYHPYNRANQERVLRDEALAAEREEQLRQAASCHRDQARLEALRAGRRHSKAGQSTRNQSVNTSTPSTQERRTNSHSKPQSGHALLRPQDELVPWYTTKQLRNGAEARKSEDQRLEDAYKDSTTKSSSDPLKAMHAFLARRKAAKDLPHSASSSRLLADNVVDQYEPEAVRAAKSRRRQRPHSRCSPPIPSRDSPSRSHRKHRTVHSASRQDDRHKRH